MDRILKIWVESARVSSSFDDISINSHESIPVYNGYLSRPPPLRTSSTYDDDDAFNNVAVNLLSRHDTLGLTAQEAIMATLIDHNQRTSFYEGLCVRLDRSVHLSPNTASLVQHIHEKLGKALKEMISYDNKGAPCGYTNKPATPRSSISYCRNVKQMVHRRFFPDGGEKQHYQTTPQGNIFGGNKRRVQNIDWKMAEAIQQVQRLQLDRTSPIQQQQMKNVAYYEPPSTQRGL
jgi:hypothetical protein